MVDNKVISEEIITLKYKTMIKRINRIQSIYNILLDKSSDKKVKALDIIKEYYSQMYDRLLQTGEYEKYKDIEDTIIKDIAEIELYLDQYVYETSHDYKEKLFGIIQDIYESENFQNYINMEELLKSIEALIDVFKLYRVYISKNEEEEIQQEIQKLKFYTLYRKQVEEIIYKNGGNSSNLTRYDNKLEKELFCSLLKIKIGQIRDKLVLSEKDPLFEMPPEKILCDSDALERLIIFDMKKNPYTYINLTNAQIFNAHLCNIGNNPFGIVQTVYIGQKVYIESKYSGFNTNNVNYSMLKAILNIITDENISIKECYKLYERFGFECRPITINMGQECIKMIFEEIKNNQGVQESIKRDSKQGKNNDNNNYCEILLEGIKYKYDENKKESDNSLFTELLNRREVKQPVKTKKSKAKKKQIVPKKNQIQERQEKLKKIKERVIAQKIITTDIDIIILLAKDIIEKLNGLSDDSIEIKKLLETFDDGDFLRFDAIIKGNRLCEYLISYIQRIIEELEKLNNKDKKFTLEETKEALKFSHQVYKYLDISHDIRKIVPLECLEISRGYFPYYEYQGEEEDPKPLWNKYKKDAKEWGIDIKRLYDIGDSSFKICVNLDDISDLPIDYKKIELIPKEKIEEIINRDEGKEK